MKVTKDYLKKLIKEETAAVNNEALCRKLKDEYYDAGPGYGGDGAFNKALAEKCKWAIDMSTATLDKTPAPAFTVDKDKAGVSVEKRLDSIERKIDQLLAK